MLRPFAIVCTAFVCLYLASVGNADQVSVARLNKKVDNVTLADASGKPLALHEFKDSKAVVVVFLNFNCPVSTAYAPTLIDLHKTYQPKGVAFLGICVNEDLSAKDAAQQAIECGLPFPVVKDTNSAAADAFKAQVSPEAFVLDGGFVLRYRGRIDNAYAARLKKNVQVTEHNLKLALDDVLANREVQVPATRAVGCAITQERQTKKTGQVTYYRDVAPILQNHCQSCHRPGEVGPFALMTYHQAVTWARDIKDYTRDHKMPPWKPVGGPEFYNERKLTEVQIATLAAWVDGGTPEGDARKAPAPRKFQDGWQLGTPDLVLTVPEEVVIGPTGRDMFRVVVLPTHLTEDRYVNAVEIRAGNPRVLHHTLNFFDATGAARRLEQKEKERVRKPDEVDGGPGYPVAMGVGFLPTQREKFGGLGGWAPGTLTRQLPEGTGYRLVKGCDVLLQLHYHRTGRVEKDRTTIGLYFAKKKVQRVFQGAIVAGRFLWIPSGEARFPVQGTMEIANDCRLYSVMPHMHMLGREVTVTVAPPGGKPFTLVAIKDWDYNWQETYFLKEPVDLKAGTRVSVEAIFDNSDQNPNNPFRPARTVYPGEQTDNEMLFIFLGATKDGSDRLIFKQVSPAKKPESNTPAPTKN